MLLVIGKMTMDAAVIDALSTDVMAMLPKVLQEDGCYHYSLAAEDTDAGIIAVAEMWRDEAALIKHLKQPWIVEFSRKYGPKMLGSTVKVYDAVNERSLPSL